MRDVFALLVHHGDPGEIADVIDQLPGEIKELWPETARTFREERREETSCCLPSKLPVGQLVSCSQLLVPQYGFSRSLKA